MIVYLIMKILIMKIVLFLILISCNNYNVQYSMIISQPPIFREVQRWIYKYTKSWQWKDKITSQEGVEKKKGRKNLGPEFLK